MSYEFFKFSLLHKNGVNYEIHVNLPIFKTSKNGQKPHKFKNHLTSCFTKVQKLDLGWSDLKFKTFLSPAPSPLCIATNRNEANGAQEGTAVQSLQCSLVMSKRRPFFSGLIKKYNHIILLLRQF